MTNHENVLPIRRGGYGYDHRQHLTKSWKYQGRTREVDPSLASNHSIGNAEVQTIAGASPPPGRTTATATSARVQNPDSGVYRWQMASPRSSGHKLDQVTDDQTILSGVMRRNVVSAPKWR